MLRPWERRILLVVLHAEVAINVLNGVASLIWPLALLQPLARVPLPHEAGEVNRWFAAVTLAFGGWLLARSLGSPHALRIVLEALCLGDVLYLAALTPFARAYGTDAVLAPFALTAIMFAARAYWICCETWPESHTESAAKKQVAAASRQRAVALADAQRPQSSSRTPRRRRGHSTKGSGQ